MLEAIRRPFAVYCNAANASLFTVKADAAGGLGQENCADVL